MNQTAYNATSWLLAHGAELLPLALAICAVGVLLGVAALWFLNGAKWIAAGWIWREFLRGLSHHRGAGGARTNGSHSAEYTDFMRSGAWRAQRRRVLRRDGRRCRDCGGRAVDIHHEVYSDPIAATPDWALTALCEGCHDRRHGR